MTTFAAPLNVTPPFSEVTAASIEASGTAIFTGNVQVSGAISVAGAVTLSGAATLTGAVAASGTATFNGPIRVGGGAGVGYVALYQVGTVDATNSAGNPLVFTVPPNSDLLEIYVDTVETWNAGSLGTAGTIEVGVSGSARFFAVIPVSATGTRSLGSSFKTGTIKRWRNFSATSGDATGTIRAFVTAATQQATAMTVGETVLTIVYAQKV